MCASKKASKEATKFIHWLQTKKARKKNKESNWESRKAREQSPWVYVTKNARKQHENWKTHTSKQAREQVSESFLKFPFFVVSLVVYIPAICQLPFRLSYFLLLLLFHPHLCASLSPSILTICSLLSYLFTSILQFACLLLCVLTCLLLSFLYLCSF